MTLPRNWIEVELGAIGKWEGGRTPAKSAPAYWANGTIPWVSPKDMKSDFISRSEDLITPAALEAGAASLVPAGSILIVIRSGILAHSVPVAVTTVEVAINQDVKALTPVAGVDAVFVAEQIRANAAALLAHAGKAGTTVESLAFERLKTFKIRLAPPLEQVAIGRAVQHLRSRTARTREATALVAQGVSEIFDVVSNRVAGNSLSTSGLASHSSPPSIRLDDMLSEPARTGLSVRGSLEPVGVRALRLSALRSTVVDLNDVRYLPLDEEETSHVSIQSGDVLISRGNGSRRLVARAALVPTVGVHTVFPDTAYRLRLDREKVLPEWFVAVWNASATRAAFEHRIRTTAGIWKVAWRDLRDVQIKLPSLDEQSDAVEALRAVTARLNRAVVKRDAALRTLDRYESAMILRAFNGQLIRPIDGDEDPSLLELKVDNGIDRNLKTNRRTGVPKRNATLPELLAAWPEQGQTFEQLRAHLHQDYEKARALVFEALDGGLLCQRFDPQAKAMILVKPV